MPDMRKNLELGLAHQRAGRLTEAEAVYREVLREQPDNADALNFLGVLFAQRGDPAAAIDTIGRAIALQPHAPAFHSNLGKALGEAGRLDAAIASLRRALELAPGYRVAQLRLGHVLARAGRPNDAVALYRAALHESADDAEIVSALASTLRDLGRHAEAAELLSPVIDKYPEYPQLANDLAVSLQALGRYDEAVGIWQALIDRSPQFYLSYLNLASELANDGDHERAMATYGAALRVRPEPAVEFRRAITVAPLPSSKAEIHAIRDGMMDRLQTLLARPPVIQDPFAQINLTSFFLSYHGMDDRLLNQTIAQLYLKSCPSLAYVAPHCRGGARRATGRLRVGLVSTFFHSHTIGQLNRGLIETIDRSRIELFVFYTPFMSPRPAEDPVRDAFLTVPEHATALPFDLRQAREAIAAAELDVLYYTDVGMAPFTYYLAFSRLAPVQCVTWGHPDTTGIPTLDYFASCDGMEPAAGEHHYSERLERLPGSTLFYPRPETPPLISRERLGLPAGRLYVCPQSLFKFHPDFDAALIEILRRDREGWLILIDQHRPRYRERLQRRLSASGGDDVMGRIRYLPALSRAEFIALMRAADVMLDPFHFSGGNTSLEALSVGTPIVTWPGEFMRGRHTHGFYRLMELEDCVAADQTVYVEKALEIATAPGRRVELAQAIAERSAVLFEDAAAIRALEDWFIRIAAA
jgi:predicted O-linked N-acetylglucosamine transferase (SPINDLY family)